MRSDSLFVTAAILGSGMVAGTFLAFSTFLMKALDKLPPAQAIQAMQNINVTVITPVFMFALFGTALLSLYLAYAGFRGALGIGNGPVLAGALFYLFGTIGVTMFCNVPLNEALAKLVAESPDAASNWLTFYDPWMMWNNIRCVAAVLSCLGFCLALAAR